MSYEDDYLVIDGRSVLRSAVIEGRPDFANPDFGITLAKKFPPYVFSINGNAALVHRVLAVRLKWYDAAGYGGHCLIKRTQPRMTAVCACGIWFYLRPERSRTCRVPAPDALLCGRCHGQGANFPGRDRSKWTQAKREAHVKLGCVVDGY